MRKLLFFILTVLCISNSVLAGSLTITSLYEDSSLTPLAIVPYRIKESGQSTSVIIKDVNVTSSTSGIDCRAMKDPYNSDIFLIKCLGESIVQVQIDLSMSTGSQSISFGPVNIKNPDGQVPISPISTEPTGQQLYSTYCIGCHNPATTKKGRTAAQISNAITTVPNMSNLNTLTQDQINSISTFLGGL